MRECWPKLHFSSPSATNDDRLEKQVIAAPIKAWLASPHHLVPEPRLLNLAELDPSLASLVILAVAAWVVGHKAKVGGVERAWIKRSAALWIAGIGREGLVSK